MTTGTRSASASATLRVLFSFLAFGLFSSSLALALPPLEVGESMFEPLRRARQVGSRAFVPNVPLPDGSVAELQLTRIAVFAPNAEIVLHRGGGVHDVLRPEPRVAFGGTVVGDPDSFVYFRLDDAGEVRGLIATSHGRFEVGPSTHAAKRRSGIHRIAVSASDAETDWTCGVEDDAIRLGDHRTDPVAGFSAPDAMIEQMALGSSTAKYDLKIAVDVDFEMYQNFSSDVSTVTDFIFDLVGAAGVIYERDVRTRLTLQYLGIESVQTAFSSQTDSALALAEYGDFWHNTPPTGLPVSAAMLLSGQTIRVGLAWTGSACDGDLLCNNGNCGSPVYNGHYAGRYAYAGGIGGFAPDLGVPDPTVGYPTGSLPLNYWPLLVFTHELGHSVGSGHTHCMELLPADQATYSRTYVDHCVNCGTGAVGTALDLPPEKGTIMSYCHLVDPDDHLNSRFLFGRSGEATNYVNLEILGFLDTVISEPSSITAPASVSAGGNGVASVSGSGLTYKWQITNGTIDGSSTSASVMFTANSNPVTLTVTATGTFACAVVDSVEIPVTGGAVFDDFTGDGKDDVIWRQPSTGKNVWWAMDGATRTGFGSLLTVSGLMWSIGGTGDFNADGDPDILWRNSTTGQNVVWFMNGTVRDSFATLLNVPSPWEIGGIGDFDSDGDADIVWRNPSTGQNVLWTMNGTTRSSFATLLSVVGSTWRIAGTGDFDNDGDADIVWRNGTTGQNVVWFMDGATRTSFASALTVAESAWRIQAIGDYDGDGDADLFWRNVGSGQNVVWFMDGATRDSFASSLLVNDLSWEMQAPK